VNKSSLQKIRALIRTKKYNMLAAPVTERPAERFRGTAAAGAAVSPGWVLAF